MLQVVTSVFAAIGLLAAYFLIILRAGAIAALLGVSLIATSFGFWHYGKVVDAYVPALSLALLSLLIFDRRKNFPWYLSSFFLAAAVGAAVLMHQLYIFHATLMFFFLLRGEGVIGRRIRDALLYGVLVAFIVMGAYISSYVNLDLGGRSLYSFLDWAKGYASNGLWLEPSLNTPLFAAVGVFSGLVSIAPIFIVPELARFARGPSSDRIVEEEIYLAQNVLGSSVSYTLFFMSIVVSILFFFLLISTLRGVRTMRLDKVEFYIVIFVVMYAFLAIIWEAVNPEFWIHVITGVSILFAMRLRAEGGKGKSIILLTLVVLLAIQNFFGAIYPFSRSENDYWRVRTASLVSNIGSEDVIAVDCPWLCARYIEHLSGARVYQLEGIKGSVVVDSLPDWRENIDFLVLDPGSF